MGHAVELFLNQVDEEFLCSICLSVFEKPVQVSCGHVFCRKCIWNWLFDHESCPVDRSHVVMEDMKRIEIPLKNILDRQEMKCRFQGCNEISTLSRIESHIHCCPFNPDPQVSCLECSRKFPRSQKGGHKCLIMDSVMQHVIDRQIQELVRQWEVRSSGRWSRYEVHIPYVFSPA